MSDRTVTRRPGRLRSPDGTLSANEKERLILAHRWLPAKIVRAVHQEYPALDIEEAISEGNLELVEAARRFRSGSATFGSYARRAIHGAVVGGHLHRSGFRQVLSGGERSYQRVYAFDPDANLNGITVDLFREAIIDIRRGLSRLPLRYQRLLVLAAAGYDAAEIAEADGSSYQAENTATFMARKKLRKAIDG